MTGDFFQLPPVTKGNEVPFFAFECDAWKKCIQQTVMLNKVFRQKDNREPRYIFHPLFLFSTSSISANVMTMVLQNLSIC